MFHPLAAMLVFFLVLVQQSIIDTYTLSRRARSCGVYRGLAKGRPPSLLSNTVAARHASVARIPT